MELLPRRGAVNVAGHEERLASRGDEPAREFARGCCLARAIQPHEHDLERGALHREWRRRPSEQGHEFLVNHLDHLLARGDASEHLAPESFLSHRLDKAGGHIVVHVGLDEGEPHLAQGRGDIRFRQLPHPPEVPEDVLQAVGQAFKHGG